jgi:hypothetical protein
MRGMGWEPRPTCGQCSGLLRVPSLGWAEAVDLLELDLPKTVNDEVMRLVARIMAENMKGYIR